MTNVKELMTNGIWDHSVRPDPENCHPLHPMKNNMPAIMNEDYYPSGLLFYAQHFPGNAR